MHEEEQQQQSTTVVDPNADSAASEAAKTYSEDELNERISAALAADKEQREKEQAAATEAEKLKSMSEKERSQYEQDKRESELAARESALAAAELKAEAAKLAAEKGIPASAVDLILGADAAETSKRIDAFKSAMDAAVQAAVEERLKGRTPRGGGGSNQNEADAARSTFAAALKGV